MSRKRKNGYDELANEIAREKFAALRRITAHLSSSLEELEFLEGRIQKGNNDQLSHQEINKMIDRFNLVREDAEEWKYFLL